MRPALVTVLAFALTGCFQMSSVLTVRADGSAELREQVTVSGMGLLALASEAEDGDDPWADLDLEARAVALGEGIRLESFEAAEDGFTAVYAIDDVEALTFSMDEGFGATDDTGELPIGYRFRFLHGADGGPATLRVFAPKPDPGKPAPPVAVGVDTDFFEEDGDDEEMGAAALQMMMGFFEDARLTVAVEVEGEILHTTAAHVDGSRVTLFDLPFGELFEALVERPELMEGNEPGEAVLAELVGELESARVQPPGTVRVRFQ